MITFDEKPIQTDSIIKIIGIGGAGGNAINTMIKNGLVNVEFIVANSDLKDLQKSNAQTKIQLGKKLCKGLGTGANPELGQQAAEESKDEIRAYLEGADMVFITAGMGGGTGTGGAPIVAKIAKELGILSLGIVSLPFSFEGDKRAKNAQKGLEELFQQIDTLIVIPNNKIMEKYSEIAVIEAFQKADNILYEAAKAISDIISKQGYIHIDLKDVRSVMENGGYAMMGTGVAEGSDRAILAAKEALSNPLLSNVCLQGCKGLLVNVNACTTMKMSEMRAITEIINNEIGSSANTHIGLIYDDNMQEKVSVTVFATGLTLKNEKEFEFSNVKTQEVEESSQEIKTILDRLKYTAPVQTEIPISTPEEDKKQYTNLRTDIPSFLKALD